RGQAHAMSHHTATMKPPGQEVAHGAEQGSVPAGSVDARVLRALWNGATVRDARSRLALAEGLRLPALRWQLAQRVSAPRSAVLSVQCLPLPVQLGQWHDFRIQ